ncbi:methionine gamma-lyase [Paraburkholderia steynii]|uniref:Methionine gamma-lyase n=1 Tax=Paraburkholderia steynii TaxID=1245441 RepID=A0A4V2NHB4_9BURK|nr:methionine gamma-lyase [Paraburkholderia steynii]
MKFNPASKERGFSTKAIHHGYDPQSAHGSLNAPVYMTSTYAFENAAEAEAVFAGESDRYVYGRQHNPTQALLEARIATLEGAEAALVTSSGMAAITSTFWTFLRSGDEIVCHHTIYSTASMFLGELVRFGITVKKVDVGDATELQQAISSKSKFVYLESPVNPTGELIDIAKVASVAHAAGLKVIVDSTFASPALQTPLKLGADMVIHSLTKYINGHGDLLGGCVIGDAATMAEIRAIGLRYMSGGVISPMSCFLILRGLKTLKVRMRQHGENALKVAQMLATHPAVKSVCYPFLPQSPQYELAQRQMSAGTGIISFELKSGFEGARRMMNRLELIACALSLGDTESLITHPAALIEARKKIKPDTHLAKGVSREMIRLSVGLEDVQDLIADLEQALQGEQ